MKKLTIDDILEKKKIIDKKLNQNFVSKMFNAEIETNNVNVEPITDILFEKDETELRRYLKLIYLCCPIFKAEELRKNYTDIKEPYDIILKVFGNNISEIMELGNFILSKYGFLDEDLLNNLKKQ